MKKVSKMEMVVKKCVGCGFCCMQAKCVAGQRIFGLHDHCKALIWNSEDNRYYCNLMLLPGIVGESYRSELYAGEGCCCGLNSWRNDVKNRDEIEEKSKLLSIDPIFQIFLKCLGIQTPFINGDLMAILMISFNRELEIKGFGEEERDKYINLVTNYIRNNRSSQFDSFIGEWRS